MSTSEADAPAAPDDTRRALPGRLVYIAAVGVATIWFLLDQATKALAVLGLPEDGRVGVDLGLMDLRLVRNENAAFDIPGLFPGFFLLITAIVVVLIARALPTTDRLSLAAAYGLVAGGALGNVADRIFRAPGFPDGAVIDFLDLRWWPVFNLADVGIVVGAVSVVVLLMLVDREERQAEEARAAHQSVRPDTTTPRR
jgi:signal peptidase II